MSARLTPGRLSPVELRGLVLLEEKAGGYWVDTYMLDPKDPDLSKPRGGKRFIHRDMCVKCQTVKLAHLDTGQCLFAPGSTFEETKP